MTFVSASMCGLAIVVDELNKQQFQIATIKHWPALEVNDKQ
ncbi:hypothetical protein [Agarivorans litoreus]|nr:hypothetical protein [Agarivorans litoreus]